MLKLLPPGTPGSVKKLNVKEQLAQLANEGEAPCGLAATTLFSINNSLFDLTNDPSNTMMQGYIFNLFLFVKHHLYFHESLYFIFAIQKKLRLVQF